MSESGEKRDEAPQLPVGTQVKDRAGIFGEGTVIEKPDDFSQPVQPHTRVVRFVSGKVRILDVKSLQESEPRALFHHPV